MNNLLVVIAYCQKDFDITKKLLEWIAELGSCKPHSLLLAADSTVPQDQMRALMDIARPVFSHVNTMIVTVPANAPWPPNSMFLQAARQVRETCKLDFLWLEPDAIPIYAGWLDDIAEEYSECPKRFMGSIIEQQGQVGLPSKYLNGVAVYPNDAIEVLENIQSIKDGTQAWDIGSASVVVPRAMNTPLIKHYYGTKELPPVFVESRTPDSPKNHVTLDFVPLQAAIFHRSKDGKLIDLLRKKRNAPKPVLITETSDTGPVRFSTVVVPKLTEIPKSPAPVVDMMPVAPNEVTPEHSEQIKRGPSRPRKEPANT